MKKFSHLIFLILTVTLLGCTHTQESGGVIILTETCVQACTAFPCGTQENETCPASDPNKKCSDRRDGYTKLKICEPR